MFIVLLETVQACRKDETIVVSQRWQLTDHRSESSPRGGGKGKWKACLEVFEMKYTGMGGYCTMNVSVLDLFLSLLDTRYVL
jgi:hypothetical protein